jgi:uncharacterized membrane protein
MSDLPPYPPSDPNLPPSAATPPPTPPYGGWGATPPPPPPPPPTYGGYGAPPTGPQPYDVIAAIKYGWNKFAQNAGPFLLLAFLTILAVSVISTIGNVLGGAFDTSSDYGRSFDSGDGFKLAAGAGSSLVSTAFSLLANIVGVFLGAALVRGALDATEGRKVEIGAMFTRWNAGQVLIMAILVGVGTTIGTWMCLLPGLVFAFFTWYSNFFVVGEGQSGFDAIMSSFKFTAEHIGNLILLFLLAVVICIAGICACGVGLLVAIPVVTIAAAYTFKVLRGQPVAP